MATIFLSNTTKYALVDEGDVSVVISHGNWCATMKRGKIISVVCWSSFRGGTVKLHHVVMNDFENQYDHKDRDQLYIKV